MLCGFIMCFTMGCMCLLSLLLLLGMICCDELLIVVWLLLSELGGF
jgi:hypothetical protein